MRKELIKIFKTKNFVGDSYILEDEDIILDSIKVYKTIDSNIIGLMCFDISFDNNSMGYEIFVKGIPSTYTIIYQVVIEAYKINISADDLPNYKNKDGNYDIFFDEKLNVIESKGNDKI